MQGKIEKVIRDRGFGFISVQDKEDSIFFHKTQIDKELVFEDLREGQDVQFEVEETPKGLQAVKVNKA